MKAVLPGSLPAVSSDGVIDLISRELSTILRMIFVSEKRVSLLQGAYCPVMRGESARVCLVLASRAWSTRQVGLGAGLASAPQHLDLCPDWVLGQNDGWEAEWMDGLNNIPPPAKWNMSERRNSSLGNRNNNQGRNAGLTYGTTWKTTLAELPAACLCPGN